MQYTTMVCVASDTGGCTVGPWGVAGHFYQEHMRQGQVGWMGVMGWVVVGAVVWGAVGAVTRGVGWLMGVWHAKRFEPRGKVRRM